MNKSALTPIVNFIVYLSSFFLIVFLFSLAFCFSYTNAMQKGYTVLPFLIWVIGSIVASANKESQLFIIK